MKSSLKEKLDRLEDDLLKKNNLAIAFSGGTDSTFLLKVARNVLKNNVRAFTISSIYIAQREIDDARKFTAEHHIAHEIIELPLIDILQHNPSDRCYHCKTFLFKQLLNEAEKAGIEHVADGTNVDDLEFYRPGLKALNELGILSPLKEHGFTKNDIREASKELGLVTWNKPAYACLLTRFPYGTSISQKELKMVEASEDYLIALGFEGVRVRSHGNLARIEVLPRHMTKIMSLELLKNITRKLKEIGYQFVTLDTGGYQSGSFDHNE
jgi:uncharacterized protein (TIGR00268 family)